MQQLKVFTQTCAITYLHSFNIFTVLQYCVAMPLKRADKDPDSELYTWYLSTFDRQLEIVSVEIIPKQMYLKT